MTRARIGGARAWERKILILAILAAGSSSLVSASAGERIRGTVVDREGKPAAGAKVWVSKLGFLDTSDTRETVADAEGAFAIAAGPGDWGVFAVRGDEGGQVDWGAIPRIDAGHDQDPAPVAIKLRAPSRFRGRLVDAETGEPIAGGRFALDDARRVEVDAQGRFDAPGLEMTNHEAYPLCPGHERRRILFDTTGRPDAELELALPRAGKVVGRVVDGDGRPIPGASVGLRTSGSIFSGSALWEKCGDDGRFVYEGRAPGRSGRLAARAPGFQDLEREDIAATTDAAAADEVVFTLRPDPRAGPGAKEAARSQRRRTVSGTVAGPEGRPVAGVVVRWGLRIGSDRIPETTTDDRGAFRLEGLPDEANVLSVMAKGLAPAFPQIEPGGDRVVAVELKPGATIRGRVVDDAGSPIEGADVAPSIGNPRPNWGGFVYLDELGAKTDRDGRFTLVGLPEGAKCDVISGRRSAIRQRPLSATDEAQNEMVLLGEGAIRGRVVDPLGNPVRNFRVQVGIPKGTKPGDPVGGFFAGYSGTGLAFTRGDGEFIVSGLTAGHLHRLTVIAAGFGAGEADRVEAGSLGRLGPADDLTITLGNGHPLRVRVFREGGLTVPGAGVAVIQNEGQGGGLFWGISDSNSWEDGVTGRADDRGRADFPALAYGKGTIVVRAPGFSRAWQAWANGEEQFDIFVQPEARLAGTVLDEAGQPIPGTRLMLSWGAGESLYVPIGDQDGRFRAAELPPGKYRLNVVANAGPVLHNGTVTLESGKTTTEEIRVKRPKPPGAP